MATSTATQPPLASMEPHGEPSAASSAAPHPSAILAPLKPGKHPDLRCAVEGTVAPNTVKPLSQRLVFFSLAEDGGRAGGSRGHVAAVVAAAEKQGVEPTWSAGAEAGGGVESESWSEEVGSGGARVAGSDGAWRGPSSSIGADESCSPDDSAPGAGCCCQC